MGGVTQSETARTPAAGAGPAPDPVPTLGITAYGCGPHDGALFRDAAPRFGVSPTLTAEPLGVRNAGLARGDRCVSVDHASRVTRPVLRALRRIGVEYVSTRSVGCDHVDVEYARRVGITVETVAYSPHSVADYTLMLMLMAVRNAKSTILRSGAQDYRLDPVAGRELRDLTVGVVGTGRIGAAVVDRLQGFGPRVLAHDLRPTDAATHVPLDELIEGSDIVTLHAPLTPETRHLLDRDRIARMKAGAFVVNTGRGALIDTDALLAALDRGSLGGAALDVVEGEEGIFSADHRGSRIPDAAFRRLQDLPNVIISPHTAFYTDHALSDMVEHSVAGCVAFEAARHRG
jgi:D-specific alpha-keto acid dehydrogenase